MASPLPSSPGRRRSEAARLAVLHAADDLVAEVGFTRTTIEAIAARAGVGKQTIYRWWDSKVDVLLDCLVEDGLALPVPDTGTLAGDLHGLLTALVVFLVHDDAGLVLRALLGEAQHNPAIAEALRRRFLDREREQVRVVLERAVGRAELAPDLDLDDAPEQVLAPVYYRLLVTGGALDGALIDGIVRRFVAEHGRPAGRPREPISRRARRR